MTMKLNRNAFEQLVREDIAWLEQQPRTLERDHCIGILKDSPTLYYDADELADAVQHLDTAQHLAAKVLSVTSTWRQPASLSKASLDSVLLNDMHEMVAQLCEELGSKRDEVPCDIWHLVELVRQLKVRAMQPIGYRCTCTAPRETSGEPHQPYCEMAQADKRLLANFKL
jgi:hypothetical protein